MTLPISSRNRRILVIDDNRTIHEDFRKILIPAVVPSDFAAGPGRVVRNGSLRRRSASRLMSTLSTKGQRGFDRVYAARKCDTHYALAVVDMRMPPGLGRPDDH